MPKTSAEPESSFIVSIPDSGTSHLISVSRFRTHSRFTVAIFINSGHSDKYIEMANFAAENNEEGRRVWTLLNQIEDSSRFDELCLTYDPIDFVSLISKARSPKAGAVSSFFGTTRDTFEGKEVASLEYEAYPDMAINCMAEICSKARKEWDLINIVIVHKLGSCPTPEISVGIVITSVHRKDSIAAVNFAINELKDTVPIWKKEVYTDGGNVWKSNKLDSAGPPESIL